MYEDFILQLKDVTTDERLYLSQTMSWMTDLQAKQFIVSYAGKRRSAQDVLIFTLISFVGICGVQRFATGQIGMGILYFFTGGLCLIGTIVDLVNYRTLANDYNQKKAYECAAEVKAAYPSKPL